MKLDRVAQWAGVLANLGVIVSLVFLVRGVQDNTTTLRIQADAERAAALSDRILTNPGLAEVLAKIKAVDGREPNVLAFQERYGLSYAEAVTWIRYLGEGWSVLEAQYSRFGRSDVLAHRIRQLLANPDQALWYDTGTPSWYLGEEFQTYVTSLRESTSSP